MGIDSVLVAANLIDVPHDQQLVGQRLERFEYAVEAFGLQRRGDAESEEDIKRPDRNRLGHSPAGRGDQHLFQQRESNGDGSQSLEQCAAANVRHRVPS